MGAPPPPSSPLPLTSPLEVHLPTSLAARRSQHCLAAEQRHPHHALGVAGAHQVRVLQRLRDPARSGGEKLRRGPRTRRVGAGRAGALASQKRDVERALQLFRPPGTETKWEGKKIGPRKLIGGVETLLKKRGLDLEGKWANQYSCVHGGKGVLAASWPPKAVEMVAKLLRESWWHRYR